MSEPEDLEMDLPLLFHGPYRCVSAGSVNVPTFSEAPEAPQCGIYLQVVKLESAYRVRYVGETGGSFVGRLASSFEDWVTGKDTPAGTTMELDPAAYRKGVYSRSLPRDCEWQRRRKTILDDTLVFLSPLPTDFEMRLRRKVEAALVRRIASFSAETAQFLYNRPLRARQFNGALTIEVTNGVKIDGLDGTFLDSPWP